MVASVSSKRIDKIKNNQENERRMDAPSHRDRDNPLITSLGFICVHQQKALATFGRDGYNVIRVIRC